MTDTLVHIDDEKGARGAVDGLVASARLELRLFCPVLDHVLYDREELIRNAERFIRVSARSRLRILLCDTYPLSQRTHRLADLANRFPSYVTLQQAHMDDRGRRDTWLTCDNAALFFRHDYNLWQGFFTDAAAETHRLNDIFDRLWERSRPDPELRTLHL